MAWFLLNKQHVGICWNIFYSLVKANKFFIMSWYVKASNWKRVDFVPQLARSKTRLKLFASQTYLCNHTSQTLAFASAGGCIRYTPPEPSSAWLHLSNIPTHQPDTFQPLPNPGRLLTRCCRHQTGSVAEFSSSSDLKPKPPFLPHFCIAVGDAAWKEAA